MVAKRVIRREMAKRTHEPENARVMDETLPDPDKHEWTLGEVAFQLGIYRQTLLRMEQRGFIAPARWRRKPTPHRVYNAVEVQVIRDKIAASKAQVEAGRKYEEEPNVPMD